jgi:hypothetical protein
MKPTGRKKPRPASSSGGEFAPLLKLLRKIKAQSEAGFEGLMRDCLEELSQRSLLLHKSGPQGGEDFRSDHDPLAPSISIEAKRFGATTKIRLDDLKSKLRETLESPTPPDLWGLVLSREMKQPDWSELERIGAEHGVTLLRLDWRATPGTLPVIAAICAVGRHVAERRLGRQLAPIFDAIEKHPQFSRITNHVRDRLTAPETGFDTARDAASRWLNEAVGSLPKARETLRSHSDLLSVDSHHIAREHIERAVASWWNSDPRPHLALLGDEGKGKTWVALSSALELAKGPDAPLILAASAKDIARGDAGGIITELLQRTMPAAAKPALSARVRRWMQRGSSARILLVIDGLNERWNGDWNEVVRSFDAEPWKGRVSLILTSRTAFWRDDLLQLRGATAEPITELAVSEFNDAELDQYLATYDLQRSELPSGLLGLIRIPRFARLAITLRNRLGDTEDLTTARLVLEDWRMRIEQRGSELRLNDEALLQFAAGLGNNVLADPEFSISQKEIHERLSADSGRDLDHYQAAISEIVEGLWLKRADGPHKYRINAALLPYAIGLDLARTIEGITNRPEIDNVVAAFEEQLRGADIGVAILRAAASVSFARRKATRQALDAILAAWIGSQNFGRADFDEIWPLISRHQDVFLDFAEAFWKENPVGRGEGEILVKGLANAAKWPVVLAELVARFPKWVGSYGKDPIHWQFGERMPTSGERVEQTDANLAAWAEVEKVYHRNISRHFRPEEDDWLPSAALAIMSYLQRKPFIETFITWAATRAIMSDEVDIREFEWLLRLNTEDNIAVEDEIVSEAASLRETSIPVADRAAEILLNALAKPSSLVEPDEAAPEPVRPTHAWPVLSDGNVITWSQSREQDTMSPSEWMRCLRPFATNPNAVLSERDKKRLAEIEASIIEGGFSSKEYFSYRRDITETLSRWSPASLGILIRQGIACLPGESQGPREDHPTRIEEASILLTAKERKVLLARGLAALETLKGTSADAEKRNEYRVKSMVVGGSIGATAAQQIEQLEAILPDFSFSVALARLMTPLETPDLVNIFRMLATEKDERAIISWLGYMGAAGFKELPPEASILVDLTAHADKKVRIEALALILNAKDEKLGKAFADRSWKYEQGQESGEAIQGTYLLARCGTHLEFEDIRARILPQALPYAVEARGCRNEELQLLTRHIHELLDEEIDGPRKSRSAYPHTFVARNAWQKVVAMDDGSVINKMHKIASRSGALGMFSIFPLTELVEAILEIAPPDGAKIWQEAKTAQRNFSITIGDFDNLIFEKFEHEDVAKLRNHAIETATNDAQLAEIVTLALQNEHEGWLIGFIRDDLAASSANRIARGVTLAGLLDSSKCVEALWAQTIDKLILPGWVGKVRAAARQAYEQNKRARYWFGQFFSTNDADQAFSFMQLFTRCTDSRSPIWTSQIIRNCRQNVPLSWLQHFEVMWEQRKARRKEIEDERKKALYFTPIVGSLSPWL